VRKLFGTLEKRAPEQKREKKVLVEGYQRGKVGNPGDSLKKRQCCLSLAIDCDDGVRVRCEAEGTGGVEAGV